MLKSMDNITNGNGGNMGEISEGYVRDQGRDGNGNIPLFKGILRD